MTGASDQAAIPPEPGTPPPAPQLPDEGDVSTARDVGRSTGASTETARAEGKGVPQGAPEDRDSDAIEGTGTSDSGRDAGDGRDVTDGRDHSDGRDDSASPGVVVDRDDTTETHDGSPQDSTGLRVPGDTAEPQESEEADTRVLISAMPFDVDDRDPVPPVAGDPERDDGADSTDATEEDAEATDATEEATDTTEEDADEPDTLAPLTADTQAPTPDLPPRVTADTNVAAVGEVQPAEQAPDGVEEPTPAEGTTEVQAERERTDSTDHHLPPPPPGSPARVEFQRVGEALLTDDGRITDTPEAKTIAIQALADRMTSTTPELVLAAMGLHIGNDMAHRLGDSRYVLVPHNEQYPSMGAEVLHVDELVEANPDHADDRVVRLDTPQGNRLVRMIAVSELMGSWSYGSNNNVRVLALQEATREEFGLTEVLEWKLDAKIGSAVGLELLYNKDALHDFLRSQYDLTQETLAERGVTEVLSYRALTWAEGAPTPDWAGQEVGEAVEAGQRPLASWSADRSIVAEWMDQRGGSGVVLVDRTPARDILALPLTGIGYLGQKEWVLLPGGRPVTLDGVARGEPPAPAAQQTAASSIALGAPVLATGANDRATEDPTARAEAVDARQWQPLRIPHQLDRNVPLDDLILRVLDGTEPAPDWWPKDESGYAITQRDLDFLRINPVQIKWLVTGEAPMGMTPELYRDFRTEMLAALDSDGIGPSAVDIRIKGSGADFYSGIHKTVPQPQDLVAGSETSERFQEWVGDREGPSTRRPFDLMWRLGIDPKPSDIDLDINSTAMVRAAREHWKERHTERYGGGFMDGHGYVDDATVRGAGPALDAWSVRWEEELGRPISLGVFESSGPFDATRLGRPLSSHFRATDWVIHRPEEQPYGPGGDEAQTVHELEQGARGVRDRGREWVATYMGSELSSSSLHPAVAALRDAWNELPFPADPEDASQSDPEGTPQADPRDGIAQFAVAAERAKAVATAVVGSVRFTQSHVQALRTMAEAADHHSARLSATFPPDGHRIRRPLSRASAETTGQEEA
ncbi:hypothetical protein [Streptomyces sp. AP-93]|uniref:hypothetical protein n=1 Tax=Streptomyces sp. AP-93 TaxID=2929048 RepID=UPI001FAF66F3|nr:hypothetical protein [Streptomyces sp. AP-93]MCJ0875808.1 hypothetical protein [Streptomyces sp. AP-93]